MCNTLLVVGVIEKIAIEMENVTNRKRKNDIFLYQTNVFIFLF